MTDLPPAKGLTWVCARDTCVSKKWPFTPEHLDCLCNRALMPTVDKLVNVGVLEDNGWIYWKVIEWNAIKQQINIRFFTILLLNFLKDSKQYQSIGINFLVNTKSSRRCFWVDELQNHLRGSHLTAYPDQILFIKSLVNYNLMFVTDVWSSRPKFIS